MTESDLVSIVTDSEKRLIFDIFHMRNAWFLTFAFWKTPDFQICHSWQSQPSQGWVIIELDRDKEYKKNWVQLILNKGIYN